MGTMGTTGFVSVRVWECVGCGFAAAEEEGGIADDGVVGCVESVSEGACDVAGVSSSVGAAIVEA